MSDNEERQVERLEKGYRLKEKKGNGATAINPAIAHLLDAASIEALAEPEFRVLSLMGERKGIRLEAVFWRALDQIARDLHVPRNTVVLWILSAAGHDRSNATSVLRSVIIGYLLSDIERIKSSSAIGG